MNETATFSSPFSTSLELFNRIFFHNISRRIRSLFYLVLPNESSFKDKKDVPDYVNEVIPVFLVFILLELAINYRSSRNLRLNDAFSSNAAGLLSLLPLVLIKNVEMSAYFYINEHYRVLELPTDALWVWLATLIGVDFGYYWVHRMAHEVNFMWAAHQVHHSSEDYNLNTALRQSALQRFNSWVFYLPLAPFLPPSLFLAHMQFNLLYQFWIHTELVGNLGPLEYILNTPSNHRVHHGRNRYCIDKNYGGALIIWDIMFGTYQKEEEKVVYGLTHPIDSWDPIFVQLCHWKHILVTAYKTPGIKNKLFVFIKGPGWEVGKPRLGMLEDIPDVHWPMPRYDDGLAPIWTVYVYVHFISALIGYHYANILKHTHSSLFMTCFVLFLVLTISNMGFIYEKKWYVDFIELARCLVFLGADVMVCSGAAMVCHPGMYVMRAIHLFSVGLWLIRILTMLDVRIISKDKQQ